jgi:DNA-binding MarR family transcriptional regulator
MCLDYLGQREDYRSTQIDIARYLNLNASTMSGIIDRIETKGYVARLPNPRDKRTVLISLTAKGARLLETSPQLLHNQLSARLEKLPDQKLKDINEALKILVESLNIEEIQASPIVTLEDPLATNPEDKENS